jgi:type I restriction enzyme, S subunit
MNNETLEKHFDLAFAAPNGVQKLRELILTFAMQGKLVPQDPNDQPASELLKAIAVEKQRLVKEGKIKQQKPLLARTLEEIPYELPKSWEWVRLGSIATKLTDGSHSPPKDSGTGYPMLSSQNVNFGKIDFSNPTRYVNEEDFCKEDKRTSISPNDVLLTIVASLGRPAVVPDNAPKFVLQRSVAVIKTSINADYLCRYLGSPISTNYYLTHGKGTAQKGIYLGQLNEMLIAIPPLAEQHRIVAKIDRLMAQCDELENLGSDRNQKRITIHTAAIDRLLTAQADSDFSTAWDFIQQHFGELYSVKENVAELRKAILQLAVMGKLVPQDPNDEPASELLKAISASKNRLVLQGKVKEPKSLPEIRSEEIQYQLPEKWEWVRLGKITNIVRGGSPRPAGDPEFYDGDIPFLKVADLTATDEMYLKTSTYSIKEAGLRKTRLVPPDTLMLTNSGATLGIPKICTFETTFNDGIAAFIYMDKNLDKPFFYYVLSSRTQWFLDVASRGQGQPNLNTDIIGETPVALPPLAEQRRIVTKIGQLMTLCNELEQQIDAATDKRTELLKALMAQV